MIIFVLSASYVFCSELTDAVCPPANVLEPCNCYTQSTDRNERILVLSFQCYNKQLDDEKMNQLLNQFISTSDASPLRELNLSYNNLTQIPDQFRQFNQLERVYLQSNNIRSITKETFNTTRLLQKLYLSNNMINYIEPGTFNGTATINDFIHVRVNNTFKF